jgi:hypothetical protein
VRLAGRVEIDIGHAALLNVLQARDWLATG